MPNGLQALIRTLVDSGVSTCFTNQTARISGTESKAATKCISDAPSPSTDRT